MKPLRRGRVAAIALLASSAGSLSLGAWMAATERAPSPWLRFFATAAWIPAVEGIAHFLKRKLELESLVLSGLATIGVLGAAVALGAESGSSRGQSSLYETARWIPHLLPLALAATGWAMKRASVGPGWISAALFVGGAGSLAASFVGGAALRSISDVALLAASTWIAARVLKRPETWSSATL
jgi:hypothetical protein